MKPVNHRAELLAMVPPAQRRKARALLDKILKAHAGATVSYLTDLMLQIREHVLDRGGCLQDMVVCHEDDTDGG